jgi:hypothetical protein
VRQPALKLDKLAGDVATILRDRLAEDSGVDSNWVFVSEPEVNIVKKEVGSLSLDIDESA